MLIFGGVSVSTGGKLKVGGLSGMRVEWNAVVEGNGWLSGMGRDGDGLWTSSRQ
jgi:hypothetical protein